tara:strand:+ start:30 stop:530 length:501 start_codon:yes stop_codon:yes gene_type:complete
MVKKKECYTKKTKAGANYTTCVEGQKKPKTIKIKKKPKKTAQKKMSAGKSVLFTQRGFMSMVGKATITKKEIERRVNNILKIQDTIKNYMKRQEKAETRSGVSVATRQKYKRVFVKARDELLEAKKDKRSWDIAQKRHRLSIKTLNETIRIEEKAIFEAKWRAQNE